jgi:hypothetical protein
MSFVSLQKKSLDVTYGAGISRLKEGNFLVTFYIPLAYRAIFKDKLKAWGKLVVVRKSQIKYGLFAGLEKGFLGVGMGLLFLNESVSLGVLVKDSLLNKMLNFPVVFFLHKASMFFTHLRNSLFVLDFIKRSNFVFIKLLFSLCLRYLDLFFVNAKILRMFNIILNKK